MKDVTGRYAVHSLPVQLERRLVVARPAERIETPIWTAMVDLLRSILRSKEEMFGWTAAGKAVAPVAAQSGYRPGIGNIAKRTLEHTVPPTTSQWNRGDPPWRRR